MKSELAKWRSQLRLADRPDEYESKRLLASLGLNVPEGLRSTSGLLDQPPSFKGPYVLKVCSPDVMHKSDVRGVYLNLNRDRLALAMRELAAAFPKSPLLIEQMVESTGPEIIAGGLMDPSLGPAVMVGTGGILTEITPDVAFRLAPLDVQEAHRMLRELRIYPVFEGYRGLNLEATGLVRLLVTISRMIAAWGRNFDQLDLNPIVWTGREWMILDAKLVLAPPPERTMEDVVR